VLIPLKARAHHRSLKRVHRRVRILLAEIETVAVDAARDMVARISGVNATDEAARNAVKAALAHG